MTLRTLKASPEEAVLALHSDPTVDELNAEWTRVRKRTPALYRTKLDNSQVCLDPVPPEEYFVERAWKRREDGIRWPPQGSHQG